MMLVSVPMLLLADVAADPGINGYFAQLGVGAILAAPAYWFWFKAERAKSDLVDQLLESERAATKRERELSTEMVPIIRDGALALREVKDSMGSLVHEARDVAEANRRDKQTRRLELIIDKLGKSLGDEDDE
jgi:hypothetical protein